jgi:cytochrome c1
MKGDRRHFSRLLPLPVVLALAGPVLTSCKQPPQQRVTHDAAAAERGLAAIRRAGCGACHRIAGLDWPAGRAGPSLTEFDGEVPIAGTLVNTPANLAAFIRNAPAAKPGSTMPPMPVTADEARDIAAYLYAQQEE